MAMLPDERRELLAALAEPDSAAGLARRFRVPRQRLNYHLRELERAGLLELVEERRKGNCIERVVRATARAYVISPDALGPLGAAAPTPADRLSAAHLAGVAARTVREIGRLLTRAVKSGKRVATLTLDAEIRFRSAAERAKFADDLTSALAALVSRYHDDRAPGGRAFRVIAAVHPVGTDPVPAKETSTP
jgi:DNA-binding transcriptional ArsR family regulator